MATKYYGTCTGSTGSKYDFYVSVTQNSQNIANNTSNITAKLYLKRNDGYSSSAYNLYEDENNVKLYVGGTKRIDKNFTIDTRNNVTVQLCSWTGDVAHNSNGKLSLSISGSFCMSGTMLSGGTVSCTFSCTNIPRVSTLSFSSSSINPTQTETMTISSASSDFSHKIKLSIGSYSHTITLGENVLTASYTIPQSWANEVTTSKKGTVTVKLTTYNGSTAIGSKIYSITLNIPDNTDYKPAFTVTLSPVSASVPSSWNCYVKGKSKVKVTVSDITYKYSATFSSLNISVLGITKTSSGSEFDLSSSGNVSVTVELKDSRGIKKTVTNTINIIDYSPVSCGISKVFRCNVDGTANSEGQYFSIEYTSSYSSVNSNNTCTKTLKYKKADESAYTTLIPTTSPYIFGGSIVPSSSYDVELTVADTLDSIGSTCVRHISSANIPFNIKKGGKGAAFGCFSETDNELTVAYNLNVKGNIVRQDITDDITVNGSVVNEIKGKMLNFSSLGLVCMNLRFKVSSQIGVGTTTTLGSVSDVSPAYSSALNTYISGVASQSVVFINPSGELILKTAEAIATDTYIYVNGMFINYN